LYNAYPKRKDLVQGLKTFTHKVSGLTLKEAQNRANKIWALMQERINDDWADREEKYIPMFSTWLNREVPDKRKPSGKTTKKGDK